MTSVWVDGPFLTQIYLHTMTSKQTEISGAMPSDGQFHSESLHALEVCRQYCHCRDHWHFLWAGMKAAGLRRGIYLQQELFDAFLESLRNTKQRVLIAGSADAAALHVLHQALGSSEITYHAIDRCQSSLQLLAQYAQTSAIQLTTGIADIQSLPQGPWDIILVHNTLVFLTEQERIDTLSRMAKYLSSGGVILCGMRYNSAPHTFETAVEEKECEKIKMIIDKTFAPNPEALELLHPMIKPFVKAQLESLLHRADRAQFHLELLTAGLQVIKSCPDQKVLPSVASDLNTALNIEAELLLLQLA